MSALPSYSAAERVLVLHRRYLIDMGRFVAGAIAAKEGHVDTRQVFETMDDAGVLAMFPKVTAHFWVGTIFNCQYFTKSLCPCGYIKTRSEIASRNSRNLGVFIWELADPASRPPHPGQPPPP